MKSIFGFAALAFLSAVVAKKRTEPPPGAVVVRGNGTLGAGEFSTITAAFNSIPVDNTTAVIFIYPGVYYEQVYLTARPGPLTIYGWTKDTETYKSNVVTISAGVPAIDVGSNDASGTLRIHTDDFKMYNVDVKNSYGPGTQAVALSNYGLRAGLYACGFYGSQDTLYSSQGTHVYLKGYIEGAVDFIFGRLAQAYFGGNKISFNGPGWVSASGREANNSAIYIFNKNTITLAPSHVDGTEGNIFLGRPWGAFARVIFTNTFVTAPLNKAVWSEWNVGDARTDNITFAEYNTRGPGVLDAQRPVFSTTLTPEEAEDYTIATAVGSDYETWVDCDYLV